jgi:hypothetical protein
MYVYICGIGELPPLFLMLCIKMKVSQERLQIDLDVPLALSYASKAREERKGAPAKIKGKYYRDVQAADFKNLFKSIFIISLTLQRRRRSP